MEQINIRDFTLTPGPRYKSQGSDSAEEFYSKILEPKFTKTILKNKSIIINLDGVYGYFPSFFDEVFGRLTKKFGKKIIHKYLKFISNDDPDRVERIFNIIDNFEKNGFSNQNKDEQEDTVISYSKKIAKITDDEPAWPSVLYILGEAILVLGSIISFTVSLVLRSQPIHSIIFCTSIIIGWVYCLMGINDTLISDQGVAYKLAGAGFAIMNIFAFLGIIFIYCIK